MREGAAEEKEEEEEAVFIHGRVHDGCTTAFVASHTGGDARQRALMQ